ncbi:hypothetical protein K1719_021953 [Acacia pycnantha]|nr:hypothetical protein K1719_021953 [Acacia pycnantha]
MEDHILKAIMAIFFAFLVLFVLIKLVHIMWWRPKSIERILRKQGIRGTSYRPLRGDKSEMEKSFKDSSSSKPIALNDLVVPRLIPFYHNMVKRYGKVSMCWFGSIPRLIIGEAELIRLIFEDNKGGIVHQPVSPLVKLLHKGLTTLEGEQWSQRRRLITPAFHLDKLKGMVPAFSSSCCNLIERKSKRCWHLRPITQSTSLACDSCPQGRTRGEQSENDVTIEDVIEECKLFFFAGQETTATLLTWTMICLSMHPNWQEKARQEVLHIWGTKTPDYATINRLKIISMILHEVLRLFPPVPIFIRYTTRETKLGSLSIPAGSELCLSVLHAHYDTNYWGDDAHEFKPERFCEGVSKASKGQVTFYPFGWGTGPRICVGQVFAMIEAKVAVATILQQFSVQLSPSYTHAPHLRINLKPQYGAPIILRRI